MSVYWQFYGFDYERFLSIRKDLRAADSARDFEPMNENAMTDAILSALESGEMKPSVARSAMIQTLCCTGEPLLLDAGLLRIVSRLAHNRDTEDLGEQLEALLGGGTNLDSWLHPTEALSGFLTPQQTIALHTKYGQVLRRGGAVKGRRRRQGGLVGKTEDFLRQLFAMEARPEESLRLLGELIAAAAEVGQGIAVTAG